MPALKEKNIKLTLAYDGTRYFGWQKTSAGLSIEGTLQVVLEKILQQKLILQAASRTDRGVHAEGQVVNFFPITSIECLKKLQFQINALLPKDIRATSIAEMPLSFHPTLDVVQKTYVYHISASPFQAPLDRFYSWHFYKPLQIDKMHEAAEKLKGTHDFVGFSNKKMDETYTDSIRTIHRIQISSSAEGKIKIIISGNHFLYKMIRTIVGTLAYIGCGILSVDVIKQIFSKKDRVIAGMTAPAHGLILYRIDYSEALE